MSNPTSNSKILAVGAYASALLLYLFVPLFIAVYGVILIRHHDIGDDFSTFHLRQMFGIGVIAVAINVFEGVIPNIWIALSLISFLVLLSMLGLVSAVKDQKTELPFVGHYFQEWFSFIK